MITVILAGDANVGKTHIVYRFIKNGTEHSKNMAPTVGVEFSSKMVTLTGDRRIKVQIWDTGTPFPMQPDSSNTEPSPQRTSLNIQPLQKSPRRPRGIRHHERGNLQKRQKMDRRNQRTRGRERSYRDSGQQVRFEVAPSCQHKLGQIFGQGARLLLPVN